MNDENKNKDGLKQFVDANREAFDTNHPPKMDFTKLMPLQKEEPKAKVIKLSELYKYAAIVVICLCAIGATVYFSNNNEKGNLATTHEENSEQTSNQVDFSLSEISPEMAEIETYYQTQVSEKQEELKSLGLDAEIATEIDMLDEEFNKLKNELGEGVDNHLIVNEMIKTYKLKLDLLEDVLYNMQNNFENTNLTNITEDETYTTYH